MDSVSPFLLFKTSLLWPFNLYQKTYYFKAMKFPESSSIYISKYINYFLYYVKQACLYGQSGIVLLKMDENNNILHYVINIVITKSHLLNHFPCIMKSKMDILQCNV